MLHKHRCMEAMFEGTEPAPWCEPCAWHLDQQKLAAPDRLGHRLLLPVDRVFTQKVVFKTGGGGPAARGDGFWQDAYMQNGVTGSDISFPTAHNQYRACVLPASLQDACVAVCGA